MKPTKTPHARRASAAALAALALAASAPAAWATEWNRPLADQSSLSFVFREMGVPVDGHFRKFSTRLAFDPAHLATAKAAIVLDLASVDAGSDEANDSVVGKAWFDVQQFPQAQFVSTGVKALGGDRYELNGQVSIKGRTQAVSAPFTFHAQGRTGSFDGSFVLKRADFAIGEGVWADFGTVANEIEVRFHILAGAAD